jgi:hypothetical protein
MSKVHKYGDGASGGSRDGAAPNPDAAGSADPSTAGAKPGTVGAYDRPAGGAPGKRRFPVWAIGLAILAAIVILYMLFFRGQDAPQRQGDAATGEPSRVAALLVTGRAVADAQPAGPFVRHMLRHGGGVAAVASGGAEPPVSERQEKRHV